MDINLHLGIGVKDPSAHLHVDLLGIHGIVLSRTTAVDFERYVLIGILIIDIFKDILGELIKALIHHMDHGTYPGYAKHLRQSIYDLIIVIVAEALDINPSLCLADPEFSFGLTEGTFDLVYKCVLKYLSVIALNGNYRIFYQK